MNRPNLLALAIALLLGVSMPLTVLAAAPDKKDLSETSLEDLMQLEVTSAARRPQTLSKT